MINVDDLNVFIDPAAIMYLLGTKMDLQRR